MKTNEDIKAVVKEIAVPSAGCNLVEIDSYLWGKNENGDFVFGFNSKNKLVVPLIQSTKFLKLFINCDFKVFIDDLEEIKKISLLVLTNHDEKSVDVFISLCLSMSYELDEEKLYKNYIELKNLFSNERKISKTELVGLFGEFFAMYLLKTESDCDISNFYQKEDRRKFDFSITDKKKIDVKTTLKPERIHHFLQQQLDTNRYDVKIISLMLQFDDAGLSMSDLLTECKKIFCANLPLMVRIETILKNTSQEELNDFRVNYEYIRNAFRIVDGINIPRIKEKNDDGVFNVEFDSDLTNTPYLNVCEFFNWLK